MGPRAPRVASRVASANGAELFGFAEQLWCVGPTVVYLQHNAALRRM